MKKGDVLLAAAIIAVFWLLCSVLSIIIEPDSRNITHALYSGDRPAELAARVAGIIAILIAVFYKHAQNRLYSTGTIKGGFTDIENLLENTNDGILVTDSAGAVKFVNKTMVKMTGLFTNELLTGNLFAKIKIISDNDEPLDLRKAVLESLELDRKIFLKNGYNMFSTTGRSYYLEIKLMPLSKKRDSAPLIALFFKDISPEKKKQIKLAEREAKYNNIISNTNDGLLLIDEEGVVYEWNNALESITGLQKENAIGYFYWDIQFELLPDSQKRDSTIEKLKTNIMNAIDGRNAEFFNKLATIQVKRTDGSIVFFEQNYFRIPFDEKKTKIGCIFRNVTEYHFMLVKLRESEEKFSKIFMFAPEPIIIYNIDDKKVFDINDRFTAVFGYDRNSVIENSEFDIIFWEKPEIKEQIFSTVADIGKFSDFEVRTMTNDKNYLYSLVSATITEIGQQKSMIVFFKDISLRKEKEEALSNLTNELEYRVKERTVELETINEKLTQENIERIKIEEALRESEEKYRTLINQIPIGIYRTTIDGDFLQANPALAAILGVDNPEDLYKMNVFEFYPEARDRKQLLDKQAGGNNIVREEMQIIKKSGEKIWIRDLGKVVRDHNGDVLFTSGTIEDISLQVNAMEDLEYSEEKYRLLFENLHDIFFRLDEYRKILTISPSGKKNFGIDEKRLIGMDVVRLNWDKSRILKFFDIVNLQGRVNNYIIPFTTLTGRKQFLSVDAHSRYDKKLQQNVVEGIARDITPDIRQREFLSAIYSISQSAGNSPTLDDLYGNVYNTLERFTGCPNIMIAVKEAGQAEIDYVIIHDKKTAGELPPEAEILFPGLIFNGNFFYLKSEEIESIFTDNNLDKRLAPREWLGIPLIANEEVIGAVSFKEYSADNRFIEEEINYLQTLAGQIASAVSRKRQSIILNFQLKFLQNLIDTIPNPVFFKEIKKNTYQGCNKSFEQVLGISNSDIIGKTDSEIFGNAVIDFIIQKDKEILENNEIQKFEIKLEFGDGSSHDCVFYRSVYYNHESKVEGIVGTILDITDMRKASEEIKHAREYAELVYNLTPSCIYTFDKDLNITSWNERIAKLTGFSYGEVIGQKCKLYQKNDLEDLAFVFMPGVKTPIIGKESIIITKNGNKKTVSKNIDLLKNSDGEIIGGIESFEDITGRKKIEEALYWQAGVNSAIAELSKAIMVIPSLKDIANMILEHTLRLTGSMTGFIGTIDPMKGHLRIISASNDIKANSDIDIFSKTYQEYSGSWGWVLRNKRPLIINSPATDPRSYETSLWNVQIKRFLATPSMSSNKLVGLIALANSENDYGEKELEIVERMSSLFAVAIQRIKAEEEIRAALGKEQDLNELKSRFISMVSHEYRTPLTAIVLATELLSEYDEKLTKENKLEQFSRIRQSVKVMNALLDDIIAYNKAELGKVEFYPQYMDIEKFCLNLSREVEMVAKNKSKIDLTVRNGGVLANVDENLVRKILVNLLSNAVKYSPDKSVVEFDVNVKTDEVEFLVRDYGIGMSETTKERLFEPFYRGENVGVISGTGLGLAVVKSSVDIHKGRIYFDSEAGKGTTFVVTIPFYEKSKIAKNIFKRP